MNSPFISFICLSTGLWSSLHQLLELLYLLGKAAYHMWWIVNNVSLMVFTVYILFHIVKFISLLIEFCVMDRKPYSYKLILPLFLLLLLWSHVYVKITDPSEIYPSISGNSGLRKSSFLHGYSFVPIPFIQ